jgi:cell division septal protein FtsQ
MRRISALVLIFFLSSALYAEKIEFFEKIEFRGVKNLDRFNVIRMSRAKSNSKGIIIDTDSLKDVLEKNIMVKNSTLSREGAALICNIEEKTLLLRHY